MKKIMLIALLIMGTLWLDAQTVTINNSGQTGSSGTGWSSSVNGGTLTITSTASANIHTSVFADALSNGQNVVLDGAHIAIDVNGSITKTGSTPVRLTLKSKGYVYFGANVSITAANGAGALDIICWADSDDSQSGGGANLDEINLSAGVTLNSQGGRIVLAGGLDNAANNGTASDGIPDNYGYRGAGGGIAGVNLGPSSGTGTVVSLLSNGGDILIRGRSASSTTDSRPGIVSQGNLKIDAGSGRINIQGVSSVNHGIELTWGATPSIAITSSYAGAGPAIQISGGSTNSYGILFFNVSSGNILIQSTSATGGGLLIEGTANSAGTPAICLNLQDNANTNIQLLSGSGDVVLTTATVGSMNAAVGKITHNSVVRYGSRANTTPVQGVTPAVSTSDANVLLRGNDVVFSPTQTTIAANTGSFTLSPRTADNSFSVATNLQNLNLNTVSQCTIGKVNNTADITLSSNLSVNGSVSFYGGYINLNATLTSTANGNILMKSLAGSNPGVILQSGKSIAKTAGTGTLTIQADARIINSGSITASGSGVLNVVLWSDYDNDNNDGGVSHFGSIASNGGHVWMGGSNSTGGSYTWNGLTVGNGPSIGFAGYNANALDLYGGVVTNGGDFLAWAGNGGGGINGIGTDGLANTVSVNAGNIVLICNAFSASSGAAMYFRHTTGTFTLVPNGGSFGATFNWNPNIESIFSGSNNGYNLGAGNFDWLGITEPYNLSSFTIGQYSGMLDGGNPVVFSNSSDITISTATSFGGSVLLSGGTITLNTNLTATNSGNIAFYSDNAIAGLSAQRNVTAAGSFMYIPQSNSFAASVSYPITNLNVASAGLTIGKSSNTATVTISAATSIAGPITIYGGTVSINENVASTTGGHISLFANTLNIASTKTIGSSGQLTIAPQNNSNSIGVGSATGTLNLPATYFANHFADGFAKINIGNASQTGNININSFSIQDDMSFSTSGTLTLNFTPVLGNNNLSLSSGLTVAGTPTYYVQTNGTGRCQTTLANAASFTLPVGNSAYNPVRITNNSGAADDFSVRVIDAVYKDASSGDLVVEDHIGRTWDLGKTNANAGSGIDFTFYWNEAEENGTFVNLFLYHHDGTNWTRQTGTTSFNLTNNTLSYTGYTGSFSPFAVVEGSTILPATGLHLTAQCNSNKVALQWTTLTESNSNNFTVQRRVASGNWTAIGSIKAAGNSSLQQRYSFTDIQPAAEAQYRLMLADKDGTISYSNTVATDCDLSPVMMHIPNPVGNSIRFTTLPSGKTYQVRVFANNGQLIATGNVTNNSELCTGSWQPGVYLLQLTDANGRVKQQKLLKQ